MSLMSGSPESRVSESFHSAEKGTAPVEMIPDERRRDLSYYELLRKLTETEIALKEERLLRMRIKQQIEIRSSSPDHDLGLDSGDTELMIEECQKEARPIWTRENRKNYFWKKLRDASAELSQVRSQLEEARAKSEWANHAFSAINCALQEKVTLQQKLIAELSRDVDSLKSLLRVRKPGAASSELEVKGTLGQAFAPRPEVTEQSLQVKRACEGRRDSEEARSSRDDLASESARLASERERLRLDTEKMAEREKRLLKDKESFKSAVKILKEQESSLLARKQEIMAKEAELRKQYPSELWGGQREQSLCVESDSKAVHAESPEKNVLRSQQSTLDELASLKKKLGVSECVQELLKTQLQNAERMIDSIPPSAGSSYTKSKAVPVKDEGLSTKGAKKSQRVEPAGSPAQQLHSNKFKTAGAGQNSVGKRTRRSKLENPEQDAVKDPLSDSKSDSGGDERGSYLLKTPDCQLPSQSSVSHKKISRRKPPSNRA